MTKRYGIDLGTTYSTISWYDDNRSEVKPLPLETEDGETSSLRSVVYYQPDGAPIVGEVAWNTRKQDPGRVIVGIKRKMGEDYFTDAIDGNQYSPQQVSAEVLKALKDNAEIEMGESVEDVVITVPAYFGERQCAATMEAAKMAGLNVLNILSEPHAAAVAFSIEQAVNLTGKHVLVYDLGGGTFDVTLIKPVLPANFASGGGTEVQSLTLNTLCKDGNRELGGLDWDEVLIDLVAEKCVEQFDNDPRLDPRNAAVLHDNCERAKRALSKKTSEMVVADLQGHMVEITRDEFEQHSSGLLLQTQMRMEQVLAEAQTNHGIGREDIDVLVCGGATRMPMVKRMIREVMAKEPLEYKNPQLLVACGAAYIAHAIDPAATIPLPGKTGEPVSENRSVRITEDSITDITCHAVGIQVIREDAQGERRPYNAVVLERGVPFGEQRDFITETLFDNQTEVCIRLFEGESPDPTECTHLMDFRIEGLPANRPRGRPIRTSLWFGLNGVISGKAVDLETNRDIDIHYDRWGLNTGKAAPRTTRQAAPRATQPEPIALPDPEPEFVPETEQPVAGTPTPVAETPVSEQPVVETPAVETPAVETPVAEPPVTGQPTVETPVAGTPVADQPQTASGETVADTGEPAAAGPFDPAQPLGSQADESQPAFEGQDEDQPAGSPFFPQNGDADTPESTPTANGNTQPTADGNGNARPTADAGPAQPTPATTGQPQQPQGSNPQQPQGGNGNDAGDPPREMPKPLKLY